MVTKDYKKYEDQGKWACEKNVIVRELVKLARTGKEEWKFQCLKARQRWKGTTDCSQGLGRKWWCRNVTSDTALSLQDTCSLSLCPRPALIWPSTLQYASFPQYWSGRNFPSVICSVKAEALRSPGIILSEHDQALSVNAEGARHEGCGMLDLVMLEIAPHWLNKAWCWVSGMEFKVLVHSPRYSLLLSSLSPILMNSSSLLGEWMGWKKRPESSGTTRAKQLWLCLRMYVLASKQYVCHCQRCAWNGGVKVSLNISSSWGDLTSEI